MREQACQDRFGQNDQAGYRRYHQKTAQNNSPIKRRLDGCIVTSGFSLREARQKSRTKRNANDAKRQLHNAVSVIEPGYRPNRQQRSQNKVDNQV